MTPSGLRTAAIVLLFRDGFSIDDLVEIFALDSANIQEHVRRSMFKLPTLEPVVTQLLPPAATPRNNAVTDKPRNSRNLKKVLGKTKKTSGKLKCGKHPDATEFDAKGRCRICMREYAVAYWKKKRGPKVKAARPPKVGDPGVAAGQKRCTKCKAVKPVDEFDNRGRGKRPDCKQCRHDEKGLPGKPERRARKIPRQQDVNRPSNPRDAQPVLDVGQDLDFNPDDVDEPEIEAEPDIPEATAAKSTDFVYSKPTRCPKCSAPGIRLRKRRDARDMDYWLHVNGNGAAPCMLKISNYRIPVDGKFQQVSE